MRQLCPGRSSPGLLCWRRLRKLQPRRAHSSGCLACWCGLRRARHWLCSWWQQFVSTQACAKRFCVLHVDQSSLFMGRPLPSVGAGAAGCSASVAKQPRCCQYMPKRLQHVPPRLYFVQPSLHGRQITSLNPTVTCRHPNGHGTKMQPTGEECMVI